MILRAFGGGELKGEKLVRFAYLDESGIGDPKTEPSVVIAGVIVHADSQWRALHEYFQELIERFSPVKDNAGLVFHAKDIWQGNKRFDRNIWDMKRRKELLRELCLTVSKFDLPVVYGFSHRETVDAVIDGKKVGPKLVTRVAYMASLAECALSVDNWMKMHTSNEVVSLVIENNNELKKYARAAYKEFKKHEFQKLIPGIEGDSYSSIIDAPSFMDKDDAPPLQLADLCSFIIRRQTSGKEDMDEYIHILHPHIHEVTMQLSSAEYS